MPVKRSLWPKGIINRNYLINIIHQQEVRSIPPAQASETAAEKRDSANLSHICRIDRPLKNVISVFLPGLGYHLLITGLAIFVIFHDITEPERRGL